IAALLRQASAQVPAADSQSSELRSRRGSVCRPHRVGVSLHRIQMEIPRLYGMLRKTSGFAVILVLALLCAARASAQSGREDYQHYCAACHEQDGKGKGEWNGTALPDLTRLSQNNGGRFPSEEVQKVVDG